MPTGDEFVKLAMKRFISENRLDENFLEYLQETFHDGMSRIFPASGLFTYPVTITPTATPAEFDLSPDPIEGIDNAGHVFVIGTDLLEDIPFENTPGDTYWIGFKYAEIVSDVYTNPRTGEIEYDKIVETAGEKADPDVGKILDLTGTIQLTVDTLFTNGVDHSGRVVKVYLKNPMSGDATVAIEECTVTFDGGSGENRITTTGTLGQSTVSTTASDYTVVCEGCTTRKGVSNPLGDEYMMIGSILGHATTPTTTTDGIQRDLSGGGGHTLQNAYTGSVLVDGPNILASDGAIDITQLTTADYSEDIANAALRITKDANKSAPDGTIKDRESGIDLKMRYESGGGFMHRVNLLDVSGNSFLLAQEDIVIDANGDRIRLTRVGVDLTFPGVNAGLRQNLDMVEISGSTLGNDGLYTIGIVVDSDELDLRTYGTFSIATLVQETTNPSLKVSLYRPILRSGRIADVIQINSIADFHKDDGVSGGNAIEIVLPENSDDTGDALHFRRIGSPTRYLDIKNNLDLDSDGRIITSYTDVSNAAVEAEGDIVSLSGDIDAVAGDVHADGQVLSDAINVAIQATAGEVKAQTNVVATTGYVRAILGDVTAGNDVIANQDVTATNGSVTADVNVVAQTGYVDATVGDVTAGDDVIADQDVIATNGNVEAGTDVIAGDDVIATADFEYSVAREFTSAINLETARDVSNAWGYEAAAFGSGNGYWKHVTSDNDNELRIPFTIPNGATLTKVEALVNKQDTSSMSMKVYRNDVDWITPSNLSTPNQIGSTVTSTSSGAQILATATLSHAMSSSIDRYYIDIQTNADLADEIHGIRITYELIRYRPMGAA